ncbi:MAG: 50S ribosomal protein L1 [Thermomicrobiales bacterium]|nr:50S ribosomal protein L1 [Thermomicrobiales bacterium]
MSKRGKNTVAADAKVDRQKFYSTEEAIQLMRDASFAKFDETVELHARLGIDPRQADQAVRSTVTLPHGTGSTVRVLVFAQGEAAHIAEQAGADFVGADDLVAKISDGWVDFDAAIATADMMGKVGSLGRVLGRRGLMPNPRSGTVVRSPEDLPGVIKDLKGGRVEFRNDRLGIVHTVIGKKRFTDAELRDNLLAFIDALNRAKPSGVKGVYLKSLSLASTMGPGIRLDIGKTMAEAEGIGR